MEYDRNMGMENVKPDGLFPLKTSAKLQFSTRLTARYARTSHGAVATLEAVDKMTKMSRASYRKHMLWWPENDLLVRHGLPDLRGWAVSDKKSGIHCPVILR